jgi:carbon-monoxide dehydrogenase large subunit
MTGIGQSVRRVEDARLLTGRGRFLADRRVPGLLSAAFVRSPVAHGRIARLDAVPALAVPGVVAVVTGVDLAGLGPLPCNVPIASHDGRPMARPDRPVLPRERVVHVGEPVALVVADTVEAARDGAEAVALDIAPLPAIMAFDGPDLWPEAPGNQAFELRWGDVARTDQAFAKARDRVSFETAIPRLIPNPLEPRGVLALPDGLGGLTLVVPNQSPHRLRRTMAESVLRIPEHKLAVVAEDFGGGFGGRLACLPEEAAVAWTALRVGRPIRWVADRSESMLTDTHARDVVARAELALDGEGRFLALRVDADVNQGAYLSQAGPVCALEIGVSMASVYDFPVVDVRTRGRYTTTAPTDVYRGVGRAEAIYIAERLVDAAARATGIDRADLRRRNLRAPIDAAVPNAVGAAYDSGDFTAAFVAALAKADAVGFPARRAAARREGRWRGLGIATYVHPTAGGGIEMEQARVRVHPTGSLSVHVGTHSHGQGHATVFAQLVAGRLGLAMDQVEVVYGDTAREPWGRGTYGSRSLASGGSAIVLALDKVIDKGRRIAAHLLEAAVQDVTFDAGAFRVAGTDRAVPWGTVALTAYVPHRFPHDELEPGLDELAAYGSKASTYPNGCHVAEVEVDAETGVVTLLAYTAVDDVGVVVNPMIVEGQIQGGIAQGVGQALMERGAHDANGQLVAGSFLDYTMPRADDLPALDTATLAVACRTNLIGAKGAGELGPVAAPPAVVNAVLDALAPLGVATIDMPLTSERVWQAIRAARA